MIQSQAALTAGVLGRAHEGTAGHTRMARATLQNASRQGFRPEASQTHLNNYTRMHKLAVPCMAFIRCSHNSASPFARTPARMDRTAARKRSGRHNPTQAHYEQHSQHDTIASGAHSGRAWACARRYSRSHENGSRHAAKRKQARFQARSITNTLEQLHTHA